MAAGARVVLANAAQCAYTGSFTLAGELNTIRHLTMARGLATASGGVGAPSGFFVFNLVRI